MKKLYWTTMETYTLLCIYDPLCLSLEVYTVNGTPMTYMRYNEYL